MKVREELNELAEILPALKKRNMYKVPEGYFEQLEHAIGRKVDIHTGVKYTVPDNYFEELPDIVLHRINNEKLIQKKVVPSWMKYAGIAAALLILVMVGNLIVNPESAALPEPSVEMEYLEYLSSNIGDIDASTLLDLGILEENFSVQGFNTLDDSMLDYYLESNLDEIELAYLEDMLEQ